MLLRSLRYQPSPLLLLFFPLRLFGVDKTHTQRSSKEDSEIRHLPTPKNPEDHDLEEEDAVSRREEGENAGAEAVAGL